MPYPEYIPYRVSECGHPQVAFRIRVRHDLSAVAHDLFQRVIHLLDVDIGPHPSRTGNGQISHEMANHMPGAILEARLVGIAVQSPTEDRLIEIGCSAWVVSGDAEVGDPSGPKDPRLVSV
jgi:hypothetical protein